MNFFDGNGISATGSNEVTMLKKQLKALQDQTDALSVALVDLENTVSSNKDFSDQTDASLSESININKNDIESLENNLSNYKISQAEITEAQVVRAAEYVETPLVRTTEIDGVKTFAIEKLEVTDEIDFPKKVITVPSGKWFAINIVEVNGNTVIPLANKLDSSVIKVIPTPYSDRQLLPCIVYNKTNLIVGYRDVVDGLSNPYRETLVINNTANDIEIELGIDSFIPTVFNEIETYTRVSSLEENIKINSVHIDQLKERVKDLEEAQPPVIESDGSLKLTNARILSNGVLQSCDFSDLVNETDPDYLPNNGDTYDNAVLISNLDNNGYKACTYSTNSEDTIVSDAVSYIETFVKTESFLNGKWASIGSLLNLDLGDDKKADGITNGAFLFTYEDIVNIQISDLLSSIPFYFYADDIKKVIKVQNREIEILEDTDTIPANTPFLFYYIKVDFVNYRYSSGLGRTYSHVFDNTTNKWQYWSD